MGIYYISLASLFIEPEIFAISDCHNPLLMLERTNFGIFFSISSKFSNTFWTLLLGTLFQQTRVLILGRE
jgi:hypothetical protein